MQCGNGLEFSHINYTTVLFMLERQMQLKAVGNFCFHRKAEKVYKLALPADETNCE